ncbi:hypothetical protein GWD52_19995 [Enterobacteriaceae bacterium 4M9]|nr:hypothetical protein [Enterobacteriaceae bacterium 4M9]
MKKLIFLFVLLACSCSQVNGSRDSRQTAALAVEVGALEKALELTKIEAQKNIHDADVRFRLAEIYHQLNRYDMENHELTALLKMVEPNSRNYARLKIALLRNNLLRNEFDSALGQYDDLIQNSSLQGDEDKGKSMMYAAIAHCKKNEFDICLALLDKARQYLPGNDVLVQNINLAKWMKKTKSSNATPVADVFNQAYQEQETRQIFSNLVLALISEGSRGRAHELLLTRYSVEDANNIIKELDASKLQ